MVRQMWFVQYVIDTAPNTAVPRADPDLPMLFSGEEILYTARLWTSGYDIFAPGSNVVFHLYSGSSSTRPKFWEARPC